MHDRSAHFESFGNDFVFRILRSDPCMQQGPEVSNYGAFTPKVDIRYSDEGSQRHAGRALSQTLQGQEQSSTGSANSLITLALLSGDTATAQRLIRDQLLAGDVADVSSALAAAASNVSHLFNVTWQSFAMRVQSVTMLCFKFAEYIVCVAMRRAFSHITS
jgi:hypothetical protein